MRIAIVGAGASGLAAAYDLARHGHEVIVFEAMERAGGLASGFREPRWDWSVERFYHHWFQTDHDVFRLAAELGASNRLWSHRPVTGYWYEGRPHQLDSPISLLRFPDLSLIEKLRFGATLLWLKTTRSWQYLESVTACQWLMWHSGRRAYETIWKPLLVGKFSEDHYRDVNMAWVWARVHSRTPRLWTFKGGFQAFFDLLADRCSDLGVRIHLQTPVTRVEQRRCGHVVSTPSGQTEVDACIVTGAPSLLSRLVPELPGEYLSRLRSLKSIGAVVLTISLARPLTQNFYWIGLPKQRFPFLVFVEHTHFVPPDCFGGDHIVYCGDYCPADHDYFKMSADQVFHSFVGALGRLNPDFDPSWIRQWWLSREPYAQPIPTVGHSRNIPHPRTPRRGLYWMSMSQIYPWDRGTSQSIRLGRSVARLVHDDLGDGQHSCDCRGTGPVSPCHPPAHMPR
ncbi:MAG: NAD(P)/FAD-dependent oxidoreductase [Armatimonadota bacterium]|nr:NAD(P)/FAD-dependent oxidoreductase [Armatimonadota bacterium]